MTIIINRDAYKTLQPRIFKPPSDADTKFVTRFTNTRITRGIPDQIVVDECHKKQL